MADAQALGLIPWRHRHRPHLSAQRGSCDSCIALQHRHAAESAGTHVVSWRWLQEAAKSRHRAGGGRMRIPLSGMAACAAMLALGAISANAESCTQEIDKLSRQLAAKDAGAGPTKGSPKPTAGAKEGQHPGTGLISKKTRQTAISPRDVLRQGGVMAEASKDLARARGLNKEGKEAACMDAVKSARRHAGL